MSDVKEDGAPTPATSTRAGTRPGLDREMRVALARRLFGESRTAELMHIVAAIVCAVLAWPSAPHGEVTRWAALVTGAAILRALLRRSSARAPENADRPLRPIRLGVLGLALAWGAGLVALGPALRFESLALITVIISGIIAGASASLLPDPPSFYITLGGMLGSLGIAVARNGHDQLHVISVTLIALFGISMSIFYRRAHAALQTQLRTVWALEATTIEANDAREAHMHLGRIIEATTDHVGTAGSDGKLRYMNAGGRRMLGIGAVEDITSLSVIDLTPARLREVVMSVHIPATMRDGSWSGETAFLHRDGHEIPVSMVTLVHRADDGSVESMSAVARDVSAQAAVHEALLAANAAAAQATAMQRAFLANTSHEIRTPLNGILGMVELLLDTELSASQRDSVGLIATSGEALLNTINEVLDLSKIEAGQIDFEVIAYELHHVVHSTVRLMTPRALAKGLEVVYDVASDVPQHVLGDPHRLRQLLGNLLANAIKFTEHGEVVVSVRATSTTEKDCVIEVSVRDTGIGISPGNLEHVFQPFRQADASTTRRYGGTGLGLSIAKRIAELLGGSLGVTSAPGRGSEFRFILPLALNDDSLPIARTGLSMRGVPVLVIDDNSTNRRVIADMFRWAGCEVEESHGVDEGLAALRAAARAARPFALVASDVQMPDRDGFDLVTEMVRAADLGDVRVMLLTSVGQRGDGQRCRDLGIAAYLQKPVSRVELIEAAVAALGGSVGTGSGSLVTRHAIDEARRKLRVLVAEDNAVNQAVVTAMLRKRNHEVFVTANGLEAVEAVKTMARFDVVLMDIQMPELDGFGATRQIRALDGPHLPIFALTANASAEERERCLDAGMDGFLTKPFRSHELFALVEGWSYEEERGLLGPTPVAPAPAPAPVDLVEFRRALEDAGIPEVGERMLELFLEDSVTRIPALVRAAECGEWSTVVEMAHHLKAGAGTVHATQLARLLRTAEIAAKEEDAVSTRALASEIAVEYGRVSAYLSSTTTTPPAVAA